MFSIKRNIVIGNWPSVPWTAPQSQKGRKSRQILITPIKQIPQRPQQSDSYSLCWWRSSPSVCKNTTPVKCNKMGCNKMRYACISWNKKMKTRDLPVQHFLWWFFFFFFWFIELCNNVLSFQNGENFKKYFGEGIIVIEVFLCT